MMKTRNSIVVVVLALLILTGCKEKEKKLTGERLDEIAETFGQFAPDDAWEDGTGFAYYGSENEFSRRQFSEVSAERLYKRRGQRQMLKILDGDIDEAIALAEYRLGENPQDAESYFILAVAYSQKNDIEKAFSSVRSAMERGMDFGRFLAGPRDLLEPLTRSSAFRGFVTENSRSLVHGPMVGSIWSQGASFWVRTIEESKVSVQCFDSLGKMVAEGTALSREDTDFTAVVKVQGLEEYSAYRYDVLVDGVVVDPLNEQRFKTVRLESVSGEFEIGVGGCAGYTPIYERMWSTIASHELDAMLMLGDNVYIDIPEMPGAFHSYTYYRRQSNPDFRKLVAKTPLYSIWDDHDAATDDIWMGPFKNKPDWKQPMVNLFNRNWVNPGQGDSEWAGCWYSFYVGDVSIFMLDGRTYRTNPYKKEKSMLGPIQKKALFGWLADPSETFKVIVSPVAWSSDSKPGSNDTWNGFFEEREEIFQFLSDNKIEGVILLSSDRHRTDLWKNEREGDYPLYEFMSGRLTNMHTHDLEPGALMGYNEKCSFGKMVFRSKRPDPEIEFQIVNIDNEIIDLRVVKRSEISY